MGRTGGYDFCAELPIRVVREIFHLAMKQEDRFPHNPPPQPISFAVPGGTPLTGQVAVRVYDEAARAADLSFIAEDTLSFTIPIDLDVTLDDAPAPELSAMVIPAVLRFPAKLTNLPASVDDGSLAIGVDFASVTAASVEVVEMGSLPVVNDALLTSALHKAYETLRFPHSASASGLTLVIYDGNRDATLVPPNTSGRELSATVEAGDWVRIEIPIHVGGTSSGVVVNTTGLVTVWRRLERTDEAVILHAAQAPDAAHATTVTLDTAPGVTIEAVMLAVHNAYAATPPLLPHISPEDATEETDRVQFYDGTADTTLIPALPGNPAISGALETISGTQYLHLQIPCWAQGTMGITLTSGGKLDVYRRFEISGANVIAHLEEVPASSTLATQFHMDFGVMDAFLNVNAPLIDGALAALGPQSSPSPAAALQGGIAAGMDTALVSLGDVVQAAPSDARARTLLQEQAAAYLQQRHFPVYTPDPGANAEENDVVVNDFTGRLLVAPEILAIQINAQAGVPQQAPEDFLGGRDLALAVDKRFVQGRMDEKLAETFPDLATTGRDRIEEVTDRKVWLTGISVTLGEGQLDVTGNAEVEIDCWWDPDVTFHGPIYLDTEVTEDDIGCHMKVTVRPGEFDVDQSCCDILREVFIPIVGWIVGIVIASTISAVKDGVVRGVAAGVDPDTIQALPPVVFGIAQVRTCLDTLEIHPDLILFRGNVTTRRVDESYEDRAEDNRLPSGDNP